VKIICRGQIIRQKCLFVVSVLALALPGAVFAEPVHISVKTMTGAQEYGAGISVGRGTLCFVVAPAHVVVMAQTIKIADRRGNTALATQFHAPDGVDAILLKVEENHRLDCPEDWDDGIAAEEALYDAEFLVSKKVKKGSINKRRFFPGNETSTTIVVQPYRKGKADLLREGDSGSALYVNNLPLGMIVLVDTSTGEGEAIKQTQLHALFSNFMLEASTKIALIGPVYQGSQENPYATSAAADFVETKTPWTAMQTSPAMARNNFQNEMRGTAPTYPDNVDYVIQSKIVANQSRPVANPKYDAKKSQTSNVGKQLLNRVSAKDFAYYLVSNIDVEVTVIDLETQQRTSHVERSEFKDPLTDDTNQRELSNDAVVRATVDAIQAAMSRFGVPITDASGEQFVKNAKKKKKHKKKGDDVLSSLLGLSSND